MHPQGHAKRTARELWTHVMGKSYTSDPSFYMCLESIGIDSVENRRRNYPTEIIRWLGQRPVVCGCIWLAMTGKGHTRCGWCGAPFKQIGCACDVHINICSAVWWWGTESKEYPARTRRIIGCWRVRVGWLERFYLHMSVYVCVCTKLYACYSMLRKGKDRDGKIIRMPWELVWVTNEWAVKSGWLLQDMKIVRKCIYILYKRMFPP